MEEKRKVRCLVLILVIASRRFLIGRCFCVGSSILYFLVMMHAHFFGGFDLICVLIFQSSTFFAVQRVRLSGNKLV